MKDIVRKNIRRITPYIAGKPIEETKREFGLKAVIKLASNENPIGASPKAIEAIKKNLDSINRYPDSQGYYLKRKLATHIGVSPNNIVLGNGSDELIDVIIKTFVENDENIITADVTFLEYSVISKVNARRIIEIPLKNFKYDLAKIRKEVNDKTKLIFISNPNNPTGTYVNKRELDSFLRDLPSGTLLVMDEAYDTFIDVKDFPDSLNYLNKKNVIILKTFSKAYGLAGLRIGYAITNKEFASCMEIVRQPFNVNLLAQAAALAALDDKSFLLKSRRIILQGKRYIYSALNKLKVRYIPTVANFILIDIGRDGAGIFNKMLKYGVIIRDMKQYGLKNFIRVTIGTERENRKFIQVLKRVLS